MKNNYINLNCNKIISFVTVVALFSAGGGG